MLVSGNNNYMQNNRAIDNKDEYVVQSSRIRYAASFNV